MSARDDRRTYEWALSATKLDALCMLSDAFTINGIEFVLSGNHIEVSGPGLAEPEAAELANRYVEALGQGLGLRIWPQTFLASPEQQTIMRGLNREDQDRARAASRRARISMIDDPVLRRAYAYVEDARMSPLVASHFLYKAIETIENTFGGEAPTIKMLGVAEELKAVKRAANDTSFDQRHAPKEAAASPEPTDVQRMTRQTLAVLKEYARYRGVQYDVHHD